MSNLQEKLNKYQDVLTALCESADDIDHAVLVTAHKVKPEREEFDTTLSVFRCDTEIAQKLLQRANEKLGLLVRELEETIN